MYKAIRPILFKLDPEKVHDYTIITGKALGSNSVTRGLLKVFFNYENKSLCQTIHGIKFRNPVGLAAGFDKNCELMKTIPCMGFGYEEVGSITAEPYEGNQGKRLVRLPKDKGIIVYYGLKNKGAKVLKKKLKGKFKIPIGVSIAKTNKKFESESEKLSDWIRAISLLQDCGDYMTLNLSCPNTTDNTNYSDPKEAEKILQAIKANISIKKPVFIKVSWAINDKQIDRLIGVCDRVRFVQGFVLTNLHKDRSKLELKTPKSEWENQPGGISGRVVKPKALQLVRSFYKKAGDRYVIIGCGGIFTAEDAYEYIKNGASLLQLITGMIYEGPSIAKRINKGLVRLLKKDGYKNVSEAVGKSAS